MSDESKKIDPLEGRWQPEAVVRLDEKPKRPRSALTAVWDVGVSIAITVFNIVIWIKVWGLDGWHPGWFDYSVLAVTAVCSILWIVGGVKHWLSRLRA